MKPEKQESQQKHHRQADGQGHYVGVDHADGQVMGLVAFRRQAGLGGFKGGLTGLFSWRKGAFVLRLFPFVHKHPPFLGALPKVL